MATNRTSVIPIGIMPKTKRNFVMVFMETIRIAVVFFQQGNDTHTVLHIIDNIELKLDCKFKIAIAIYVKQKSQLDIFPKSQSPTHRHDKLWISGSTLTYSFVFTCYDLVGKLIVSYISFIWNIFFNRHKKVFWAGRLAIGLFTLSLYSSSNLLLLIVWSLNV